MDPLRLYLLAGIVGHKLVWEALKRRRRPDGAPPVTRPAPGTLLLKGMKLAILTVLVMQTLLPDILRISAHPSALRIAGAVLFTIGLIVAVLGRLELGENWSDIEDAAGLRQPSVIDTGIYHYVRHPIYGGDLLLLLGFQLSVNSWLVLGLVPMIAYVVWQATREEILLARTLPGYAAYCARTRRFVPFVV